MSRAFTPATLANHWGCSESQVRERIAEGKIDSFKLGDKLRRITADAVAAYEAKYGRPRPAMPCDVYVVGCGDFIKIGKAVNPQKRILTIKTDNPFDVEVIAIITEGDGHAVERVLHKRFSEHHHRGEWFRRAGSIIEWIEGGCVP